MAVDLATNPGGFFRRLGKEVDFADKIRANQVEVDTEIDDILDQYAANRDHAVALQPARDSYVAALGSLLGTLREQARRNLLNMVNDDDPLQASQSTVEDALRRLADQMAASSDSIDATTITVGTVTAGGSNVGTGTFIVDDTGLDGNEMQTIRTETLRFECFSDAEPGGSATAGREMFDVRGEPERAPHDPLWPGGSGINRKLRITSAEQDAGSKPGDNMLVNSDFEVFT